jgi:hypothetical protein
MKCKRKIIPTNKTPYNLISAITISHNKLVTKLIHSLLAPSVIDNISTANPGGRAV